MSHRLVGGQDPDSGSCCLLLTAYSLQPCAAKESRTVPSETYGYNHQSPWECQNCGSRRVKGSPDEGYLCLSCGQFALGDFETENAFGGRQPLPIPDDLAFDFELDLDSFFSGFASRTAGGPHAEAHHADAPPPRAPRTEPRAPLLLDSWSFLRCACCYAFRSACLRRRGAQGPGCCPGCRCPLAERRPRASAAPRAGVPGT